MANSNHHGQHSFENKNILCTMESYTTEIIGRFGRIFKDLPPLYTKPKNLSLLGAKDGPMDGGVRPKFTNTVPLGMIFFGQFIDHDITFDTTSNFSKINNPNNIENTRSAQLDLDCIFGGGPEDEPFLYNKPSHGLYLLTGKTNNNVGQGTAKEKHDLPRTGTGTAIIGDPRNDENRVISQLQLAFIRFYNAIYADIANKPENAHLDADEVYKEAKQIVTWHYQWIVLNEFLPILCGESVVNDILSNGRKVYCPHKHAFIPVEFSVAAYRFGHSMIAQNMKLKPSGDTHNLFSPQIGGGFSRIENLDQVIKWEAFFDFDGNYQRAEKLDTCLASILLALPFVSSNNPDDKSLATRNLRRGQSFLLPSGENVAKALEIDESIILDVKNFIHNSTSSQGVDFSLGTPLWYYILAEAQEIGRVETSGNTSPGEGLGPVGARITAEVIIGLLELDSNSYLGSNRDWVPHLGTNNDFSMKDLLTISNTAIEL